MAYEEVAVELAKAILGEIISRESDANQADLIIEAVVDAVNRAKTEILNYLQAQEVRDLEAGFKGLLNNISDYQSLHSQNLADNLLIELGKVQALIESKSNLSISNMKLAKIGFPLLCVSTSMYVFFLVDYLKSYYPNQDLKKAAEIKFRIAEIVGAASGHGKRLVQAIEDESRRLFREEQHVIPLGEGEFATGISFYRPDGSIICNYRSYGDDSDNGKCRQKFNQEVQSYIAQQTASTSNQLQVISSLMPSSGKFSAPNNRLYLR